MDAKQESSKRRARMRRKRRLVKLIKGCVALGVVAALGLLMYRVAEPAMRMRAEQQESSTTEMTEATAQKGTLLKTVFGSGTIQPVSQPGLYASGEAVVAAMVVELGDEVKAGDVLMQLENPDLEQQIADAETALYEAQETVESTKTYEQYRYEPIIDEETRRPRIDKETGEIMYREYSNELSIRSPSAGRVMAVYIEPGDDALAVYREKGAVIMLSTDGRMKVELDVNEGVALELGQKVQVSGMSVRTEGTVTNLERRGTQAVIEVVGDEYAMNTAVTVTTLTGETVGTGVLAINKPMAVSAYGGTIKGVAVEVGDTVEREDVLARFIWGEGPLYIDNASVLLDYAKAKTELEALREQQDALVITAPCDGRIASLDVSVGDTVESGTLLLSLVEDGAGMTLTLSVDEMDIVSVEPGQAAVIEPDALEGVTLTGTVEKIAPLGDTTTAVTTYDVTIALDSVDERVMAGMNVSGEIVVDTAEEALPIPTDALSKRDGVCTVTLRDGTVHEVTVGLMTRDQVQILSGLSEGDTVIY